MPARDGSGGSGYPGGGSETIIPVRGTGEPGDPQTVYFHNYYYRPNVSGWGGIFCRRDSIWIRIKRLTISYYATSGVVGQQLQPSLYITNAGMVGFTEPMLVLGHTKVIARNRDDATWEFLPNGLLLVIPPQTEVIGTPALSLCVVSVGYDPLDDARVFMEYEWGVWPE